MKKVIKKVAFIATIAAIAASCSSPKPVKTIENLKEAIAGETNANAKYTSFSQKAAEEGYPNISKMFAATAAAEAIHIKNHQTVLGKLGGSFEAIAEPADVKSSEENIQSGIEGETYESTIMYPGFLETANIEKSKDAVTTFTWAMEAEKKHAEIYNEVLSVLRANGNDSSVSSKWYVCPKCGNVYMSIDGVENCDICGTSAKSFINI